MATWRERFDGLARAGLSAVGGALLKAAEGDDEGPRSGPGGSDEDSAENTPAPTQAADDDPKSLFFDPFSVIQQLGYKDRPSQITYGTLRAMVARMPILAAIIQTRINQVAAFSAKQHNRYQLGYRIQMRDHEGKSSPADRKWIKQVESLIERTGVTDNPRGRDSFTTFLKKSARDSLMFDQMAWEIVANKKGQPAEWYAVDASTIRLADAASVYLDEDDTKAIRYVQIYDGMVVNEYAQDELYFGVRNPSTDIRLHGYGTGELEMMMVAVTSLLFGWAYNQNAFKQGTTAKGIVNFKGKIPRKQFQAFKTHWYNLLSSVENAWRSPVTNADQGIEYVNLQQSSRDMEFSAWMDFMIKVCCSCYAMDPVEVNFQYGNVGQSNSLKSESNREKITQSKERGLRPLLRFLEASINRAIIWPMNESFEFAFVGLDAQTREDVQDENTKAVKTYKTVDEIRAEDDLPPIADGKGKLILDPTWLQFSQGADAAAQGDDQGGGFDGGQPGGGDEDEDEDVDFAALLGGDDDEDDDEDEKDGDKSGKPPVGGDRKVPTKPGQPGKPAQPIQKSMPIIIDLTV